MASQDWSASNIFMFLVNCLTCLFAVTLCTFTMYQIWYKNLKKTKKTDRKLLMLTSFCFIAYTCLAMVDPPMCFYIFIRLPYHQTANLVIVVLWYISWLSAKISLYAVYILRLYITFQNSAFAHSRRTYIILLAVWSISAINLVVSAYFQNGDWNDSNNLVLVTWLIVTAFDCVLILMALWLFVSPIIQLLKVMRSEKLKEHVSNSRLEESLQFQPSEHSSQQRSEQDPAVPTLSILASATSKDSSHPSNAADSAEQELTVRSVDSAAEERAITISRVATPPRKRRHKLSESQQHAHLLATVTRITLLAITALCTSFVYQLLWVASMAINHRNAVLYAIGFVWGIDSTINMLCLYLSTNFASAHYHKLCVRTLRCHQACTAVIRLAVRTNENE